MTLIITTGTITYELKQQKPITMNPKTKQTNRTNLYIDLIGSINPIGFSGEKYFFIFTNNAIRMIEMYIGAKKSD